MKKKRILSFAVVAAMLSACSNEVPALMVDEITDTPVVVKAGVADLITRAGMTTAELTNLALFINNETNATYTYGNVKFDKTSGVFKPASGEVTPLWQNAKQEVNVVAYSPYNENWTLNTMNDFEVGHLQTDDASVKKYDLLWASSNVTPTEPVPGTQAETEKDITYSNGSLNISLKHILSKLIVNVRFTKDMENVGKVPVGGVKIQRLSLKGKVNLQDGSISDVNTVQDITACSVGQTSAEAVFPPQNSAFDVEITLGDTRKFVYRNNAFDFKSGYAYTLNLVIGNDEVEQANVTAADWNPQDSEELVY